MHTFAALMLSTEIGDVVDVKAPDDKGARGRIGWIVSQLADADGEVVVEAYAKNARVPTSATLDSVRGERGVLLGGERTEPYRFVIKRRVTCPQEWYHILC